MKQKKNAQEILERASPKKPPKGEKMANPRSKRTEGRSKYGVRHDAEGVAARTIDGIKFDSKAEAVRYSELKLLQRVKAISGLTLQPKFPCRVMGELVCTYKADFQYVQHTPDGRSDKIIEDVKGVKTAMYRLKKKLVEAIYKIQVIEV